MGHRSLASANPLVAPPMMVIVILVSWRMFVTRTKVVFECDSELAVGWLRRPHRTPANLKEILSSCLRNNKGLDCSFHFVHRECNTVADGLAKKRIGRRDALVIIDPP
ncbi:hypothetical protein V6N13_069163 [Hibiscus sabdariffa]